MADGRAMLKVFWHFEEAMAVIMWVYEIIYVHYERIKENEVIVG